MAAWSSTVAVVTVAFFAFAGTASAVDIPSNFFVVVDTGGANDVNASQVDLTQMGRDDSDATTYKLFWSWDAIDDWTGTGQTGDACALFDNDGDGNVNFSVCARIENPDADPTVVELTADSPFLFVCNDAWNDRCGQPEQVTIITGVEAGQLGTLDPDGNLITDTDPFPNLNPDQDWPFDSTLEIHILKSLVGFGDLVNVCTYPSAGNGGNNNPFDCILNPGSGILVIEKDAGSNTTTSFSFLVDPGPTAGSDTYTIVGSGETAPIQLAVGSSQTVTETVPSGWRLDGASCTLEGGAATGTPTTNGVTGIAIQSGLVTTCTFTDTQLNPAMTIDKSSTTPSIDHVGQVVPYTFLVTNTGNVALTGITVTDTKVATVICPATTLAVGANMTCTGNYTVTQADLDDPDGELNNTATADSDQTGPVTDSHAIPIVRNPALSITKVATEQSFDSVGDVIHYTIVATNTGNVTLTNVTVTDPVVSGLVCTPANGSSLAPGASMTCTATHTITQADLDAGHFANTACVDDGSGGAAQACADEDVPGEDNPALSITKVATEQSFDSVGDVIHYTIVATNTGNVTLTNVTVTDPVVSGLVCTPANGSSLAPGASMTCTATHTITQADLDAGHFANTACVDDGSGGAAQACADEDVPGEQNPAIGIAKNPDSQTFQSPGTANFSITVTNTGNVTLTAVHVDDALALDCERTSGELGANATLAPGATFTYTCSQGGVTASFTNSATATGTPPQGDNVSATDTADVVVTQPPPPPPPPPVVVVTRNLTITKTDDPDPVTVGNNLTYTVIVTNQGPGGATGVTAADQLPATATFVSASSTQGTCSQASGVVTCNLGTLASGASATITIVVRPTATGTILNTVMVVANEAETNNADNTATAPTLVVGVIQPPAPTCASLTVTPRQLTVGKRTTIVARVRLSNGRPFTRARVRVVAPGITKAQLTNAQGIARITVRPTKAGIARVNVVNNPRCAVRRVGIIGVFQPPLTG